MSDVTSIVDGDDEPGGDGWTLTVLAQRLGRRIPLMCFEKLMREGRESIPTQAIPKGVDQSKYAIYKRYTMLGKINLADTIITAVTDRQRPNGFRLVSEAGEDDMKADNMYRDCHMDRTLPRLCDDVATHGQSFVAVSTGRGEQYIRRVSPWCAEMSDDGDDAIIYWYDKAQSIERIMLMRLTRDETGNPASVYSRTAWHETDSRTLVDENDEDNVRRIGDTWETDTPAYWLPPTGWKWEGEPDTADYTWALACGHIPIIRCSSVDGRSQIFKHLATLMRISQGIFDRMCISIMQAFRQRAMKGLKKRYYRKGDPQVEAGLKRAGEKIDYSGAFEMGPASLWLLPEGCEIWESQTTDITPLVTAESSDIKHLAAASRTPLDILSPDVAGSAEGASLKREGLAFKVEQLNRLMDDAMSLAVKMALVLSGDKTAIDQRFEMVWLPTAPQDWQSAADASQKIGTRLPDRTVWREVFGMSERQMALAEQDMADATFTTTFQNTPATTTDTAQDDILTGMGLNLDTGTEDTTDGTDDTDTGTGQ